MEMDRLYVLEGGDRTNGDAATAMANGRSYRKHPEVRMCMDGSYLLDTEMA
jgi:hypothetical protein